jgi:hypothetical protein
MDDCCDGHLGALEWQLDNFGIITKDIASCKGKKFALDEIKFNSNFSAR